MNRRRFLGHSIAALLTNPTAMTAIGKGAAQQPPTWRSEPMRGAVGTDAPRVSVKLFLCGDVMTGRGIDQILPHPSDPRLYEPYARSASQYVVLAETKTGPLERPVDFAYIWGDALAILERERPDARIINLETAITTSEDAWPAKGIHYRMHPANVPALIAAQIDCCTLANNHVLDWGYRGLAETLTTLRSAGISTAGAGTNAAAAAAPAIINARDGSRLLVFAFGTESAGVPREWAATDARAGVNFLHELSQRDVETVARQVKGTKRARDIAVAAIHWGANWGYAVRPAQREFAHRLIDSANIDVVLGHSSHHPMGIEVYRDHLILYGCGDFLNDYEGIGGYESFRSDLTVAYFPSLDTATGRLTRLALAPMQIRHFRLNHASAADARWLEQTLTHQGKRYGTRVAPESDMLVVRWNGHLTDR
jgi:poly-gamma-glutamate capsule biosynthesis protein CapA/YwtB (metallophosphatase superfamily)